MSGNGKTIEFIDSYTNGIFNGNIGFIRYWSMGEQLNVSMFLQNLWEQDAKSCKVYLDCSEGGKKLITEIYLLKGKGEGCCILSLEEMQAADMPRLLFEWAPEHVGVCRILLSGEAETMPVREPVDKWAQMQEKYPCFYPFAGQGCYVILQESEWGLLPGWCRRIRESDFYQESYRRCHHMIVGEYEIEGAKAFYLGLSGLYNEEAQSSAAEAGFMGYEFSGAAGYYLYLLGECL